VKEFGPGIFVITANDSDVGFHGLVLSFSLAIGLLVKGGHESVVKANVTADQSPESADERRSAVCDAIVWYAVPADHAFQKICVNSGESISYLEGR